MYDTAYIEATFCVKNAVLDVKPNRNIHLAQPSLKGQFGLILSTFYIQN